MCAWKENIKFEEDDIEAFNESWKISVETTFRLLKRITQLKPHRAQDTLSVNNIRSIVSSLARPLNEIAKTQATNVKIIEEKLQELERIKHDKKALEEVSLYIDEVAVFRDIKNLVRLCLSYMR